MKRIIIIGEGPTEQSICNDLLKPHFTPNTFLQSATIKKTKGGIVNWQALKHQIENHLLQDRTALVTTLIDYYGIYPHHKYPNWEKAAKQVDPEKRMDILEDGMLKDIRPGLQYRFTPYIQLHEVEALIFNNIDAFKQQILPHEFTDIKELENIILSYPNPELINNNRNTAPSKRLGKLIVGYRKTVHGPILAETIGLPKIRAKCPRFNDWITKLENI